MIELAHRRPLAAALAAASAAVLVAGAPLAAQAPPEADPPPARGFAEQISVGWVLVPALVRDRRGDAIDDLERDDFRLTVEGEPVPIATLDRGEDASISLVVLQDLSGSMGNGGKIEASRRALGTLVERARPGDELALASFAGGRLEVEVPFTDDRGAVHEAMAAWEPYGTTMLHDAVAWIPDISADGRHPKRAVLLLTDGVDNASAIDPDAARRVVERAHLPVYVVGLGGGGGNAGAAARNGDGSDTYALLLQRLAHASGGRYFAVARPEEVAAAVDETLDLLRREYVLGFPTGGGDRAFRRIRVEAGGGRLIVTHRLGYTGGPPLLEPPATAAATGAGAPIPAR
jgi:Ca-activated chloride channel family protein